jgi:hypothetical protein
MGLTWIDIWHHYQHDPNSNLGCYGMGRSRPRLRIAQVGVRFSIGRGLRLVSR